MSDTPASAVPEPLFRRPGPLVLALVLFYSLIEAVLQGADHGLWGSVSWRPLAYQYGGFWAGLLYGWKPNYALQPVTMFFSYSFLHADLSHLAGNMLALVALGNLVRSRLSPGGFLALWALAALAGALGFALIAPSARPMVGTSGALFGLAGVLIAWEARARRQAGESLWPALGWVLGLAGLNLAFWALQGGNLAWQAHLGGFLAGVGWGWLRPPHPGG